jgi:aminomethyltransferase
MKNSPLASKHLNMNAKVADFGGWLMPIEYPQSGVIAEYSSVRERVGIFDVSHLGKISVKGDSALVFLNQMVTNDLNRITDGQAQYTLLCNENGGVVDDLIIYRNSDTDFFLVPNAANTVSVFEILKAEATTNLIIENLHEKFAVIALQGPKSFELLNSIGIDTNIDYMQFLKTEIGGVKVILCRTGYTGELGFEIIPAWSEAGKVWDILVENVNIFNGLVCGLGARDLLRTEMGYPLHGHELSLDISPVEAAAGWAVGWNKSKFRGQQILVSQKQKGVELKIKAISSTDRGIPRKDMQVKDASGKTIGRVTSGTYSPALKKGIGLALIHSDIKVGEKVVIDIRGKDSIFEIVSLPFVPSKVR